MPHHFRWQIGIALCGFFVILALLGTLTLSAGATAPAFHARTYIEGVVGVPRDLNPLLQTANSPTGEADLTALLFEGLTRPGTGGMPRPELAERWQIDPTGRIYTFTLRSGLHWHDGTPLTTADVAFTIRSVQDPAFGGNTALRQFWQSVKVEPLDQRRIRFTHAEPFAPFLAATALPILPMHLLGDVPPSAWNEADFNRHPIGSGPFRLHAINDEQAMLVPFEGAARPRPSLDLLVLRFYPSAVAAQAAFERGDIQGFATRSFEPLSGGETPAIRLPLAAYTLLLINTREAPLDDVRLRTALAQGLDRAEIVQRTLGGAGRVLDSPILPQTPFHGVAAMPASAPEQAQGLLDTLGWPRDADMLRSRVGQPLRLPLLCVDTPADRAIAQAIAGQFQALGIDIPVEAVSAAQMDNRLQRRDFALALRSWQLPNTDPDAFGLWHSSQADTGANASGIDDRDLDDLLLQGQATTELAERVRMYQAFEQRWIGLLPAIPLFQHVLQYQLSPEVQSAGLDQTGLLMTPSARFRDISAWTVLP